MKKFRTWSAYSVYVLLLGAFFVYILFPAETVSRYIVARAAAVYPDVHLTIGDVSPILPPGLKLNPVVFEHYSGDALTAREIRLYPRWLSLLGKKPAAAFTVAAGQGTIRGTAAVTGTAAGRQFYLNADLEGVQIEQLDMPQALSGYRLQGAVSGKIRYSEGKKRTADVQLTVSDMTVAPPNPVMGIRQLHFENLRTEATMENRDLKLNRVVLAGKQVNGEISGVIVLARHLQDSNLSLGGTLQLNLKADGPGSAFNRDNPAGGGIALTGRVPVRIRGTLANPKVSLR